jgi:hypothetical protein
MSGLTLERAKSVKAEAIKDVFGCDARKQARFEELAAGGLKPPSNEHVRPR